MTSEEQIKEFEGVLAHMAIPSFHSLPVGKLRKTVSFQRVSEEDAVAKRLTHTYFVFNLFKHGDNSFLPLYFQAYRWTPPADAEDRLEPDPSTDWFVAGGGEELARSMAVVRNLATVLNGYLCPKGYRIQNGVLVDNQEHDSAVKHVRVASEHRYSFDITIELWEKGLTKMKGIDVSQLSTGAWVYSDD